MAEKTDEPAQNSANEFLFLSWLESATDFWSNLVQTATPNTDGTKQAQNAAQNRFLEQWKTNLSLMKSFSQAMREPESASSTAHSIDVLPKMLLKMTKSGWDAGFQIQKHLLEKISKIGTRTEAYNFDNMDEEVFKASTEIYEKELQQYFHVPTLGLTRYYQERFNELLDKNNLFETTLAEFFSILYLPVEKSFKVLQEKMQSMAQEGMLPREAKDHYAMWLKILEGHYMNLFKSKEYTDALHKTLGKMEDFILAKDETIRDFLQLLPIPTNKEMDDLYKEFHLLKKRVKELEKQIKVSSKTETKRNKVPLKANAVNNRINKNSLRSQEA
jgi:polyhydroxyalkanoate synthase subunit PhaE